LSTLANRLIASARVALTWAKWGVWGGAAAGVADAVFSALRLWDQIAGFRRIELFALGAALGSGVGVFLALVAFVVSRLVGYVTDRTGKPLWSAPLWAALLSLPLVWRASFSIFAGPKARQFPAHGAISVAFVGLGILTIGAIAYFLVRAVTWPRRPRQSLGYSAFGLILLLSWLNTTVMPRLYPWFHECLAALVLAVALVVSRLFLTEVSSLRQRLATVFLVLISGTIAFHALTTSRQVRFALFDKTAALGAYARFLPLPEPRRPKTQISEVPLSAGVVSLPEGPKRPKSDVVLITIDAVRPDHVGAYGYARPTTPNLDALAAQSTVFERAYTQAPHTSFATTSMLTGKYYPTLLRLKSGEAGKPITTVLRRYGWRTAAFFPPAVFFVDGDKLATFRDSAFQFEYVKVEFMAAEPRIEQIKEYFDTVKPERAFLWVHFFEPHEPYESHDGFAFGGTDKDRYDSEIAYTDSAVGRFIKYLKDERPNSIVIVSADHGEEFDEHQGRYHGSSLYEEQVRVPMIIHVPGGKPRVVKGQVELLDLAPTILSLLDIPLPARMKGTDLGPWLSDAGASDTLLPPAFAEVEDKRMIVSHGEKLICSRNSTSCQLFDLVADPHERSDLVDAKPLSAEALHVQMERWLDEQGRLESLVPEGAKNDIPKSLVQGRMGEIQATPGLLEFIAKEPHSTLAAEAAQLLANLPPQPKLATTFADLANAIQSKAQTAAAWLRVAAYASGAAEQTSVSALVQRSDNASRDLVLRAALALAERGKGEGVPTLIASLAACNGTDLCRRAIRALGELRAESAVDALHETMLDPNARLDVVHALGRIKSPKSLPILIEALRHNDRVPVRAAAAAVVALYAGNLNVLRQAARVEKEPSVKSAIEAALGSGGALTRLPQ
jgi:arylsulfatase A-like enzyme